MSPRFRDRAHRALLQGVYRTFGTLRIRTSKRL